MAGKNGDSSGQWERFRYSPFSNQKGFIHQGLAAFPLSTTCPEPDTPHCCCFTATSSNHVRHPRHLRLTPFSSRSAEQAHPMLPTVRMPRNNFLATLSSYLMHAWSSIGVVRLYPTLARPGRLELLGPAVTDSIGECG